MPDISVVDSLGGAEAYAEHDGISAIFDVYALCLPSEKVHGRTWYRHANRFARKLGALSGKRTATVAAVIARLSPRITWAENKNSAFDVCHGRAASVGYPDNVRRAELIADSDTDEAIAEHVLPHGKYKRPKISEFYRNIADPTNARAVTVDTWAARIWCGDCELTGLKVSADESARIQDDYRLAASVADILPQELQAIVWIGAHRIAKDNGQGSLFSVGLQFKI